MRVLAWYQNLSIAVSNGKYGKPIVVDLLWQ